ncbi:MAG: TonB system transport protein ExbD [Candidatus Thiothrix sulfatifontis]|uniref:Biopolymer transport protein ExbD n=1 Tax=Thiothrix subterranea TaxID=2735563 RepID=A0AA51MQ84_9GAMM|nr:TonB system transport protein ExbD [Thiothrix subterranea]MDQ5769283.1 TonB system transport protein ExbD [Thiothrix subterranea]UOG93893.1 MAG: TonB system transport protein ExbD [Candidatus Thiothrix sulfatifontis]WML86266.1 TonB system transport protein ExbD [Thiothrix subterranea]
MKRFDQINMIPFIDIMLVLLAIVLTTASFVSQGLIPVNLPTAEQVSEPSKDEEPLEIAINEKNEFFLGEEKVTLEQMAEKLKVQAKPETLIVLRIDKAAVFEHFVKLIDLLKAQELNNLSIQAQQEP